MINENFQNLYYYNFNFIKKKKKGQKKIMKINFLLQKKKK